MTRRTTFAGQLMEVSYPEGRPDLIDGVYMIGANGKRIPEDKPIDLWEFLDNIRTRTGESALAKLSFQVEEEIEAEEEITPAARWGMQREEAYMEAIRAEATA